jgi:glycosyltransferase involved in cell wall biosynthesis
MRIAQVAPLFESVPPKLYGGTERVVSYLTEELVRQGHEVALFASGDSQTSAKLMPCCSRALWSTEDCRITLPHHVRQVEQVVKQSHRFDIIHFHLDYVHFPAVERMSCPTITTLHGQLHPPDERSFFESYPNVPLVSISNDQRRPIPNANWQGTVYHGMPTHLHTYQEEPGTYLAFLGRISPEKGVDQAIEIARRSGMRLRVAARIYPDEESYFKRIVEPLFRDSPWVDFIGEVGDEAKDAFLGNAFALIFPINWSEPFGLVMIESMACGTPVIAYRRGSVPEVMTDGITGYVVDTLDEAVEAVNRVRTLSRRACREVFETRFDSSRMAHDYIEIYRRLISTRRNRSSETVHPMITRPIHLPNGLLAPVGLGSQ